MFTKPSRTVSAIARRTALAVLLSTSSTATGQTVQSQTPCDELGWAVSDTTTGADSGQIEPIQVPPPVLNTDPNADINELLPPTTPPPSALPVPQAPASNVRTRREAGLGATAATFAAAPNMIGDLFGGGLSTLTGGQTIPFGGSATGTILSGGPGRADSQLVFEFGNDLVPNDVFTSGTGLDLAGADGFADTFQIFEPLPPNGAPTSPGPGFIFDGGTAVYTGNNPSATTPQPGSYVNNDNWFVSYSYSQSLLNPEEGGRPIPTPGVAVRRIKLSENFSPEVRNRCFASYNFFNDAYAGLGDVSRYTLGFERVVVDQLVSLEARLLMAGTYGSTQILEDSSSRDFELGNAALIGKGVLLRNDHMIWTAGLGFTIPSADDTVIRRGGQNIVVIKNRTVHLLPFSALLIRPRRDTFFQAYVQLDVAANGDPIYGNLAGGDLPRLGVFTDSTLVNLDFALSHVIYTNRSGSPLRQILANGELHYSGSLQESDFVTANGLNYSNLTRYFNVLNATLGLHLLVGDHVVVTPAMSVPLRDGYDEQFDYEAIVQVNYLH